MFGGQEELLKANRLVYLSMAHLQSGRGGKIMQKYQSEHNDLMQLFHSSEDFEQLVRDVLNTQDLRLLWHTENYLILSTTDKDSLWAMRLQEYKGCVGRDVPTARILLAHLAIANEFFPESAYLEMDLEDLGIISCGDVVEGIKKFTLSKAATEKGALNSKVQTVLADIQLLPERRPDIGEKQSPDSLIGLVSRVLEHLSLHHYLTSSHIDENSEVEYRPTEAYRESVRTNFMWLFSQLETFKNELLNEEKAK